MNVHWYVSVFLSSRCEVSIPLPPPEELQSPWLRGARALSWWGFSRTLLPRLSKTLCHFTHSESQSDWDIIMGKKIFIHRCIIDSINYSSNNNDNLNFKVIINHSVCWKTYSGYKLVSYSVQQTVYTGVCAIKHTQLCSGEFKSQRSTSFITYLSKPNKTVTLK